MKHRRQQLGFTLLEVLVAIVIVGMISAALAASMHVAFKARNSATEGAENVRAVRLTLDLLGRDLQNALPPAGVLAGSFVGSDAVTSGDDSDNVSFSNSADPARRVDGAGDIERVALLVINTSEVEADTPRNTQLSQDANAVSGAANGAVLVRRVTRHLLASVAEEPPDQVLCRGVRGFNLRYFDGSQWSNEWDSSTRDNALPVAVEVTLSLAKPTPSTGGDAGVSTFVRVFQIPCGTASTSEDPTAPPPLPSDTP